MLRTHVKASSITNLTDARYFAAWGVKWLGFQLDSESENFVKPAMVKAMMEWVDGVEIVAELSFPHEIEIDTAIDFLGIKTIQLGAMTSKNILENLPEGIKYMLEVEARFKQDIQSLRYDLERWNDRIDHFLFTGLQWNDLSIPIEDLQALCWDFPIILSMDFTPDNIETILEQVQPTGIELKGGAEEKVGFKSYEELDPILELLEKYP